ncbi:unnamed protein product [Phyllotreta striolata]|uniref:Lipid scramblase CLPTM1L n=1 Tax=Phyllotreta striolata TaxID=444603 RepID=A0A9N9U0W1_PHYSR|nr:unnamed protein product [Phyllotreta striolata]
MLPSLSTILTILFFGFIFKSMYSLYTVFQPPRCQNIKGENCFKSYLNDEPKMDLLVFVTDNSKSGNMQEILRERPFDYTKPLEKIVSLDITKPVRNNGSFIIHSVLLPSDEAAAIDAKDQYTLYDLVASQQSTYVNARLTKYAVPVKSSFNLLKDMGTNTRSSDLPVPHLKSKYVITMCSEKINVSSVPFELAKSFRVTRKSEFLPLFQNDVLSMRTKDLVEITQDTRSMNLTYIYNPTTMGKLRFLIQIEMTLRQFISLGFTEKDLDDVKGIFADTSLYLLCLTFFIGSVHLLLDFLSFKSDVSFWKSQTSMAGLSTRAVLWRAFSQTVVFLFLLDEGTSLLVLVPSGIGTLIEFWKVSKVFKTKISWRGISFDRDRKETDEEKLTRKYDEECMNYLSYLIYPLCVGSAVYSLMYQPHKSWYSWTINSAANGVYAFGFVFMTPQLFVNYRLKSVAALPWKAFTYRAFNTFIDDVFAFVISMPMAHRVACFRDDIVFVIYLYQRWLYPVDKSRREGYAGEDIPVESKKDE